MPRTEPFDKYINDYEIWFEENKFVYESELEAVKHFIPSGKIGIEIGIGTGRFALPTGIKEGIEPSASMRKLAEQKGLIVYEGTAEEIPLPDESYDFALMVTTICFVDDVNKAFQEVKRILKPNGSFVIGLVDKNSPLGRSYEKMKEQNKFYRLATFYSTDDVINLFDEHGFINVEIVQTVFGSISEIKCKQDYKSGYGEGGFVVISASKK